jgi:hypothetical protein
VSEWTERLEDLGASVIDAKQAADAAAATLKAAQDRFVDYAESLGTDAVLVSSTDGFIKVAVVRQERRTFDVATVREHFPLNVLAKVIRESVDPKAFDAAVTLGVVTTAEADKAIAKITEVKQVRIYE